MLMVSDSRLKSSLDICWHVYLNVFFLNKGVLIFAEQSKCLSFVD
jgi:hypothetical protein